MKAMILVLSPRESRDLLNGDLSVLVRKKFPKDYVGWVYIYVARNKLYLYHERTNIGSYDFYELTSDGVQDLPNYKHAYTVGHDLNGKVVAKFEATSEECINPLFPHGSFVTHSLTYEDFLKQSCLSEEELNNYLGKGNRGTAIHIKPNTLKIFDKPKELSEFEHHFTLKRCERRFSNTNIEIDDKTGGLRQPTKHGYEYVYPLTSAPRNGWCYVEVL